MRTDLMVSLSKPPFLAIDFIPGFACGPRTQNRNFKANWICREVHDRRNSAGIGVRGTTAGEGPQGGRREVEIGVVQNIEEFRPKLNSGRLGDLHILCQIDVQSRVAG